MARKRSTLEEDVLAAFERACREGDCIVAEHLLQTLEAIAKREGDQEQLDRAYLHFARAKVPCHR